MATDCQTGDSLGAAGGNNLFTEAPPSLTNWHASQRSRVLPHKLMHDIGTCTSTHTSQADPPHDYGDCPVTRNKRGKLWCFPPRSKAPGGGFSNHLWLLNDSADQNAASQGACVHLHGECFPLIPHTRFLFLTEIDLFIKIWCRLSIPCRTLSLSFEVMPGDWGHLLIKNTLNPMINLEHVKATTVAGWLEACSHMCLNKVYFYQRRMSAMS